MSKPSYAEARAEGYELAKELLLKELGREPTQDELDEGYEHLCERYSDEMGEYDECEVD